MSDLSEFLQSNHVPHVAVAASVIFPENVRVAGKPRPTRNAKGGLISPTLEGIRNFWRWFGDSRAVDVSGRPVVYYHGTHKSFDEFTTNNALGGAIFVSPDPKYSGLFAYAMGANIVPVYVKVLKIGRKVWDARDEVRAADKTRSRDADGFYLSDSPMRAEEPINLAVFSPSQLKSAVGNNGTFSPDSSVITAYENL